jgi:hypothetical protein
METKSFLGSVYLFSDPNEKKLKMIKNITSFIELNPCQKLFSENDENYSLLNKEKRTATVTAVDNYDDLECLLNAKPIIAAKIYKSMAKTLSKGIKDISENIEKRFQPTKFIWYV